MCRSLLIALTIVLSAGVLASCGLMGKDGERLRITPHPDEYDVASDDTLFATITNIRELAVFYICLPDIWIEQYRNGEVIERWQVRGLEECAFAGKIELGQSASFALPVPPQAGIHSTFDEVHYRLEARLYRERDGFDLNDPVYTRSNSFSITDSAVIID